jgi:hypothetical protein
MRRRPITRRTVAGVVECTECGFVGDASSTSDLAHDARMLGLECAALLTESGAIDDVLAVLRTRPAPTRWSALEYGAHTRDALRWYAERIRKVLTEGQPQLVPCDFDAVCEKRRYNEEDPDAVACALEVAAEDVGALLAAVPENAWDRAGIGSDGGRRTVRELAERAVHEGFHHRLDITRSLEAALDTA